MAKEKKRSTMQVGGSTILMIFTVLCLTVFSVLSLSSARADASLTKRAEQAVLAYYDADGKAEERLQEIDQTIAKANREVLEEAEFSLFLNQELGEVYQNGKIQYEIPLENGKQSLFVEIEPIYQGKQNFNISQWQIKNTGEYFIDDSLNVWLGE